MQLDKTHVVIRARTFSEIGDLALSLVRHYPQSLFVGFVVGAVPWIVINTLLIGWIPWSESVENIFDEETVYGRWRYLWLMAVLVYLETPIAGVFTTYYIGQAVFEQRPPWRSVFRATLRIAHRWIWSLGILRGPLPAIALLATNWYQPFSGFIEFFLLGCLLMGVALFRGFRPFLPEILLLERCPLVRTDTHPISAPRRNSLLHGPLSGDLFGRKILGSLMIGLIALSIFGSLYFLVQRVFNTGMWSLWAALVLVPLALWTAAGFSVLVRYVSYLDARIRLEGWEVELALRAEAIRQFGEEGLAPAVAAVGGETS